MAIPSVIQGTVEVAGKVFEVDSPRGLTWLESVTSFRFVPAGASKPYTVRKESGKGGDYWYGYRKVAGKLHKKYIGKSSDLSTAKLEEIAETLNIPPQSRVTYKVTEVTEVTEAAQRVVTDRVTDNATADRLTALELQVQALQESLEASVTERTAGKIEGLSDSPELLKPIAGVTEVTDNKLQTKICNLKAENEILRADYAKLLESSTHVTNKLREEAQQLRLQLAVANQKISDLDVETSTQLKELRTQDAVIARLNSEIARRSGENSNNSAPIAIGEFPEPADLLNKLKGKRKKSKAELPDIEKILEILEGV